MEPVPLSLRGTQIRKTKPGESVCMSVESELVSGWETADPPNYYRLQA